MQSLGGMKEFFFSRPYNNNNDDEMVFYKQMGSHHQYHFNHLSPEHDNSKVAINSHRAKYMLNKTAGKTFFNQPST
jgi:hypothetical protein